MFYKADVSFLQPIRRNDDLGSLVMHLVLKRFLNLSFFWLNDILPKKTGHIQKREKTLCGDGPGSLSTVIGDDEVPSSAVSFLNMASPPPSLLGNDH